MSSKEKYESILSFTKLLDDFAPNLIRAELGSEKLEELQDLWRKGTEQIPDGASDIDKYEVAYRNFMGKWVTANNFMGKNQGEFGMTKYMHAAIDAWNRKYSANAFALRVVETFSAKTAFKSLSKRLAFSLQVFSPFTIAELSSDRMVLSVSPCKILQDKHGSDFCSRACRNIIPVWLEKQFKIKMIAHRQDTNCSVVFEPFKT